MLSEVFKYCFDFTKDYGKPTLCELWLVMAVIRIISISRLQNNQYLSHTRYLFYCGDFLIWARGHPKPFIEGSEKSSIKVCRHFVGSPGQARPKFNKSASSQQVKRWKVIDNITLTQSSELSLTLSKSSTLSSPPSNFNLVPSSQFSSILVI